MALTDEQYAKLMSGLKLPTRAKVAGLPAPKGKEEKSIYKHIDSQNAQRAAMAETNGHIAQVQREMAKGRIDLAGAPRTLEESGLLATGFEFDESQLVALDKVVNGRHVCLIGAAGTGKTTLVKSGMAQLIYGSPDSKNAPLGIRQLSGDQGPSIAICAFTGIATHVVRRTLPSWLHGACKTIHTLLEYKPIDANDDRKGMFAPSRTANNKLDHDLIVIDEASMLGLDLWHNLVDALRPHTRIILIGDLNQLKPVADATMFAYALSAGIDKKSGWDIAELTTIHRQKEAAANKIIDGAHAILNGKNPVFDNPADPDWRFIGYELPPQADKAHAQIVGAIEWLRKAPTPGTPERPIFDPYKDLLLTAGNGYDENDSASLVQQAPLNGSLSRIIEPPTDEHPMYIIDAGRETRRFAVGHRVMATKNESPAEKDRVTNGMTGRILSIEPNPQWNGKVGQFGTEKEVNQWRAERAKALMNRGADGGELGVNLGAFTLEGFNTEDFEAKNQPAEKQASHILTIKFNNGATRTYRSAADVESIMLGYAVTVHKAQGSQADTVVIVCHQAVKGQLSREWLYTAVTRAQRRVVVLYTRMGLSKAVNTQQIFGASLREKVNRYRQVMESSRVAVRLEAYATTVERARIGDDG